MKKINFNDLMDKIKFGFMNNKFTLILGICTIIPIIISLNIWDGNAVIGLAVVPVLYRIICNLILWIVKKSGIPENTKLFNFFEINTSFWDATAIQDKIFAVVVALLFGGITILQQKLGQRPPKYQKQHPNVKNQQQTDQQKTMNTMMIVMNVMFVFMSLSSTALAIYWLIGGIYQIFQSFVGRKINERNYEKQQKENI